MGVENFSVLDKSVLNRLIADVGKDTAVLLLQSLKKEIENATVSLDEYLQTRDMAQLENQAHALKSAVRSFGAMRLGACCLALEEAGKHGIEPVEIKKMIQDFESVSVETLSALGL